MKKHLWLVLLVSMLLTSCYSRNASPMSATVSPTRLDTQISPTKQLLPTVTTFPIKPVTEAKKACIEINSVSENKSRGVIVFKQDWHSRLTFQDRESATNRFVPVDPSANVIDFYFSHDDKKLIYQLDLNDPNGDINYILTDASGITQKEVPFNFVFTSGNIFWLNNKVLRVAEIDVAKRSIQNFSFDPFSGTKSILKSDFPDVVGDKNIDWDVDTQAISMALFKGTNIVYDASLLRVLYPKGDGVISLYNLETNSEIAQTKVPGWGRLPEWSPDGKYLAIIGTMSADPTHEDRDEFLLVSRDGPEFQQLTHLTSVFQSVHIERYSWSPNGQQIAFWLKTENTSSDNPANPFELAVLDFQTGQITLQCLTGTPEIEFDTYSRDANLIWSPDGTQLLIAQYTSKDKKKFHVILVDLAEKTAYEVAQNMYQVGWMTKEP